MSGIFTLSIECVGARHLKEPCRFMIEAPAELTLGESSVTMRIGTARTIQMTIEPMVYTERQVFA